MKNKKGQVTLMVTIVSTILFILLFASASYISSLSLRNDQVVKNRQLTELSKGSIMYATSVLKREVDIVDDTAAHSTAEIKTVDYNSDGTFNTFETKIDGKDAILNATVQKYIPLTGNPLDFESYHKRTLEKSISTLPPKADVSYVIHINNAQNVCYQLNWSGSTTMQVEVSKVKEKSGSVLPSRTDRDVYTNSIYYEDDPDPSSSWVVLPIKSSTSPIGQVPTSFSSPDYSYNINDCSASMKDVIPAKVFYDLDTPSTDPAERIGSGNGYGPYRIRIKNVGTSSSATNLQLKVLYNRLSYRTYKITSNVEFGDYKKNNISAYVRAEYSNDETEVTPKFKIIRWIEGVEK